MNKQRLNAVQCAATAAWITFRFGTHGLDCARKTIKSIRHSTVERLLKEMMNVTMTGEGRGGG